MLDLLHARNKASKKINIDLIYPFFEHRYLNAVRSRLIDGDNDYGRLPKEEMYDAFSKAYAVFSLPISDSSPRSVYEAIFCGAAVIACYGEWIELLPQCMRKRIVLVDLNQSGWFDISVSKAKEISSSPFRPSIKAVQLFDEKSSLTQLCTKFYII